MAEEKKNKKERKPMNKLIKLPLFLGVVGCLCGGVLSLTNYVTADKIAADEEKRANAAYILHFDNLASKTEEEIPADLAAAGVTNKFFALDKDEKYIGTIYSCSVVGFAGKNTPINFTISFANGKPNHYVGISHGETSQGAKFMDWLAGDVGGDRLGNLEEGKVVSGSSVSFKAVSTVYNICFADYTADMAK